MIKEQLIKALTKVVGTKDVDLEFSENEEFGDYATNIAMQIASRVEEQEGRKVEGKDPRKIAEDLVKKLQKDKELSKIVEKIEVAGPGFINFWVKKEILYNTLNSINKYIDTYGKADLFKGKKILIEHTSPNPQTTIMLGHLRNNFLGMSVANVFSFLGAKVVRDCIVNDRGIHICRSIWGYLAFGRKNSGLAKDRLINFRNVTDQEIEKIIEKFNWKDVLEDWCKGKSGWYTPSGLELKSDHANLIWYVLGSRAYKQSEEVHKQVGEILQAWEKEDSEVWQIWRQILDWSKKGYDETYKRVGSIHDWVWHESELYKGGKELVNQGLKKGVFQKSKSAIVTNLKKYDLTDTVVIKSDGTATYLVFDLNLTFQKQKKFPSDLYIWTIGAEQSLYFKQLFAVCEQLGLGKRENFFHLSYALINFKGWGKMATREGSVVMADEILDQLESKALDVVNSTNQTLRGKLHDADKSQLAKVVALGAIKFNLLRYGRETTAFYDVNESISVEGNSGPYLQYTYARTQSVLQKAGEQRNRLTEEPKTVQQLNSSIVRQFNSDELLILRTLPRFSEVIVTVAKTYSPNLLCNYLFDLAQKYNLFYNKHRIIESENKEFRLELTRAVGQVLKNGLNLLGIVAPERM